jgi:hypothetical protein
LDANDDKDLCRYEFLEIIVRIAKIKYIENSKYAMSIAEATKKIIDEHIIPNFTPNIKWQEFRDEELWELEVDELLKTN